jgi:hypothetical protein
MPVSIKISQMSDRPKMNGRTVRVDADKLSAVACLDAVDIDVALALGRALFARSLTLEAAVYANQRYRVLTLPQERYSLP